MANYTLQSHGGAGLYMTADGTPTARRNVYIKARVSASLDQTWRIDSPSNGARTRIFSCKSNNTGGYALNNATGTNNCDIISHIGNYKDSLVEFERYGTNVYYIKATPRNDMKKPHHLPISANCGGGSAYFRCMGKLNQAGKQRLSARIRFASANNIFNFAVCFRRPRYRVFRYRNRPFTTPKTCSTFARTDDFSCSLRFN